MLYKNQCSNKKMFWDFYKALNLIRSMDSLTNQILVNGTDFIDGSVLFSMLHMTCIKPIILFSMLVFTSMTIGHCQVSLILQKKRFDTTQRLLHKKSLILRPAKKRLLSVIIEAMILRPLRLKQIKVLKSIIILIKRKQIRLKIRIKYNKIIILKLMIKKILLKDCCGTIGN